jgi:16S rRNA (adenine(1408)-N(1))-methyltransferase
MERICGRRCVPCDGAALIRMARTSEHVLLDLGTGDGRFVDAWAQRNPAGLAIGLDACREQLAERSRRAPANVLYLIANALAVPAELDGLATRLTINFPWGTLLTGLLAGEPALCARLPLLARPGARLKVRLNAGALAEAGWMLEAGGTRIRQVLRTAGFAISAPAPLGAAELRACPTTWAQRLAVGRDPRALYLLGERLGLDLADVPPFIVASGVGWHGRRPAG